MSNKHHYVYLITEIDTNRKYIGLRSCECLPIYDLGIDYFSSSRDLEFRKNQIKNPDNYKYEILKEFNNRLDAANYEIELHEELDVSLSDEYINLSKSVSTSFDVSGRVVVKDKDGNTYQVLVTDPRYISGELVHHSKGVTIQAVKDYQKKSWKENYDKRMADCQNPEACAKRSISVKQFYIDNPGAAAKRNAIVNRDPEKIRKTAEKHRGMKRTDSTKENISDAAIKRYANASKEDYNNGCGKGMKYVTNLLDYTYKRLYLPYELLENEVFGMIRDPSLPLKKESVVTDIELWVEKTVPAGYVMRSCERKGNLKKVKSDIVKGIKDRI